MQNVNVHLWRKAMAQNSHISDHLMVTKLGAIAAGDLVLVYLIDMAILHETGKTRAAKAYSQQVA